MLAAAVASGALIAVLTSTSSRRRSANRGEHEPARARPRSARSGGVARLVERSFNTLLAVATTKAAGLAEDVLSRWAHAAFDRTKRDAPGDHEL